ncbi:MAG: hypothetical protein M5U28_48180 [Sandaracinaceae bacterium]|nr:hypothetical protein [Sandaracinaceae bacterium]
MNSRYSGALKLISGDFSTTATPAAIKAFAPSTVLCHDPGTRVTQSCSSGRCE